MNSAPLALLGLHANSAAVRLQDLVDDREAEPRAAQKSRLERLEDAREASRGSRPTPVSRIEICDPIGRLRFEPHGENAAIRAWRAARCCTDSRRPASCASRSARARMFRAVKSPLDLVLALPRSHRARAAASVSSISARDVDVGERVSLLARVVQKFA